jgi:hypothetical protein
MPRVGSCVPARDGHRGEVTWPAPASAENRTSPAEAVRQGQRRPKAGHTALPRKPRHLGHRQGTGAGAQVSSIARVHCAGVNAARPAPIRYFPAPGEPQPELIPSCAQRGGVRWPYGYHRLMMIGSSFRWTRNGGPRPRNSG